LDYPEETVEEWVQRDDLGGRQLYGGDLTTLIEVLKSQACPDSAPEVRSLSSSTGQALLDAILSEQLPSFTEPHLILLECRLPVIASEGYSRHTQGRRRAPVVQTDGGHSISSSSLSVHKAHFCARPHTARPACRRRRGGGTLLNS
ncbi:hypothetical protein THAOC_32306, partial [Thalassiosira oceanica]